MSATAEPVAYVYRLKGGAIVHPTCREPYAKKHSTPHFFPGIEAGLYPGYAMPSGRFQLCAHCEGPIWDAPKEAAPAGVKAETVSASDDGTAGYVQAQEEAFCDRQAEAIGD